MVFKEQWNFYVSGILYDKFFQEDEKIMISKLDVYSGKWQEKTLFSESESENLKKYVIEIFCLFLSEKKIMKKRFLVVQNSFKHHGTNSFN